MIVLIILLAGLLGKELLNNRDLVKSIENLKEI